ncbi:MAG: methylmalonyl-CoA epimerase [Candidatus Muiribacterium halophilum]|uniref:Methylmalonyl-CoA epimerase n=1 Tax=Muiribacterium halophilum TaxID=2053465 RepID=A0A2N5ZF37_MUIH1|nr:MAG: methylmalonyl-CoA epimerase [Candidatus Muirbacterium halophilum]
MKIDHVGIAVKDIQEAAKVYEAIGVRMEHTEELQGMKVGFLQVGESSIELLQSITPDSSPIGKFIEKKGEGIHHIAIYAENIEQKLKELEEKGFRLIDKTPRSGAHGKKVAFLHPKSTNGVLLELCEKGDE